MTKFNVLDLASVQECLFAYKKLIEWLPCGCDNEEDMKKNRIDGEGHSILLNERIDFYSSFEGMFKTVYASEDSTVDYDATVILDGSVEVNESFLTGEVDPIPKGVGDTILSGSFIVSGSCYARVENIGSDNYISKISSEAKYNKKVKKRRESWS